MTEKGEGNSMDKQRLARIDGLLNEMVEKKMAAGVNALVLHGGAEQYYGQAGYADVEAGRLMQRDSIFRLFSMSKPVTAAAAMILVERGVIDLLDPVEKYLPGFRNPHVCTEDGVKPCDVPVVLKDLLGMTSGMPYGGTATYAELRMGQLWDEVAQGQIEGRETGTVEFADRMGRMPLEFRPGQKWKYGVSADVMGAVIEVASGKRFGDFLREEIFEPLGMKDTGFSLPLSKKERFTAAYRVKPEGLERWGGAHLCLFPEYDHEPAFQSGGAGLVSTIDDYARFAQMLANGGELDGVRILSRRTVRYMASNQLTPAQQDTMLWDSLRGHGYGNFMRVVTQEGAAPSIAARGEFGWDGWLGTYFAVDPEDGLVMLFMIQRLDSGTIDYTRRFRDIVYSALE